ncbi:GIY-YIG nuclease family protein [Sarcina ventriculi]|uniref:GIY-YIG nuclease family protein n=1 Tax=Sarcina ventriculi TaxID=1267 RepID=UPI0018AA48DF|nr:GIY-YIG nuclease family protein [Sarcina ventriculi]
MNYTYILECSDGSFYTGWTNDLEKRINCHNKGKGAKYTRGRLPLKLVYFEEFIEKRDAQKREYVIKHLTRNDKLNLIKDFNLLNLERS